VQYIQKNWLTFLLTALLAVLLLVPGAKAVFLKAMLGTGLFNAGTKTATSNKGIAAMAPLSFTDKNGSTLNTVDLKGKVIFINFWATWCPPCVAEMGSVNALFNKLKNDPHFVFILADADNNLSHSTDFMNKHQYNLPVYTITGPIPENIFSGTLPTTLIVDTRGQLVQKHEGMANYDTQAMLQFLTSLLINHPSPAPPAK